MTAPYEKAKLAGYTVEPDFDNVGGWRALDPKGEELSAAEFPPVPGVQRETFPTERAAWEACDSHRMYGHAACGPGFRSRDAWAELLAAGYSVNANNSGWQWNHVSGAGSAGYSSEGGAWDGAERHMRAVAAPPTLETRRVVVLRTENLSLATCTLLDATPLESWPVAGGKLPHGFYIYAHDEGGADDAPADLQAVCTWANKAGFDYIQFDHDCDTFAPGLPVYDHAPRPPVDALEAFAKVRALFATWEGWSAHADGYDPAELLAAIAEAVGAELNGKPAAPVTDTLAEKMERYNDALGDLGISPNGDDFNALLDFAVGQPYREPHEKGR